MFPFFVDMQNLRSGWLDASTQDVLHIAMKEALQSGQREVTIEHFLLVACRDNHTIPVLEALTLDIAVLSVHLVEKIGHSIDTPALGENSIPFSYDLQQCIDRALAVVVYPRHAPLISPVHLLLSALSLEKVRSWLNSSLSPADRWGEYLTASESLKDMAPIFEAMGREIHIMMTLMAAANDKPA